MIGDNKWLFLAQQNPCSTSQSITLATLLKSLSLSLDSCCVRPVIFGKSRINRFSWLNLTGLSNRYSKRGSSPSNRISKVNKYILWHVSTNLDTPGISKFRGTHEKWWLHLQPQKSKSTMQKWSQSTENSTWISISPKCTNQNSHGYKTLSTRTWYLNIHIWKDGWCWHKKPISHTSCSWSRRIFQNQNRTPDRTSQGNTNQGGN